MTRALPLLSGVLGRSRSRSETWSRDNTLHYSSKHIYRENKNANKKHALFVKLNKNTIQKQNNLVFCRFKKFYLLIGIRVHGDRSQEDRLFSKLSISDSSVSSLALQWLTFKKSIRNASYWSILFWRVKTVYWLDTPVLANCLCLLHTKEVHTNRELRCPKPQSQWHWHSPSDRWSSRDGRRCLR